MPVEMGIWRIDGDAPRQLDASMMPSEATLEDFLVRDASLLGERLLVIGRQVRTPHGKYIDLLAMDVDGNLHVLELKRDKTPRDVVAQVLDYGSWVSTLDRESVIGIANDHLDVPFESAFEDVFNESAPDELNSDLQLTVIATDLDSSSQRIVTYLRDFGLPINAVFFSFLEDEDRRYLARTWLASEEEPAPNKGSGKKKADWNGVDWYVAFGAQSGGRVWSDGHRFGFVAAGGGDVYSRTFRTIPVGDRLNVYVPQRGYVAVGRTTGPAVRFDEAVLTVGGVKDRLSELTLDGTYKHTQLNRDPDEMAEWILPVQWIVAVPADEGFREPGMFATPIVAGRLKQQFTLDRLASHFGIDQDED